MLPPIVLRTKTASAQVEPDTGFVRHLRFGGTEVLRAIYVAVRESNWATLPNEIRDLRVEGTEATWVQVSQRGDLRVVWNCSATLSEDGFRFVADGISETAFLTNRTGLCVLHPSSHAGCTVVTEHPDGSRSRTALPVHVAPHQPIRDIRAMHLATTIGHVEVRFAGEVFEMEDQRNWSDDSFKTYCRPLDLPKPYPVAQGEKIRHEVSVCFPSLPAEPIDGAVETMPPSRLPQVGILLGEGPPLSEPQVDRLRAIGFDFLAVWLDRDWESRLGEGTRVANLLGVPIQAHVLGSKHEPILRALQGQSVREVVLDHTAPPEAARAILTVPVLAASRDNFTELNRQPPCPRSFDGVGFALNPQVHAFDDRSIMETTATHGLLAGNARQIGMGKRVAIGPVSFASRRHDPRLHEDLGAAWTFASCANLLGADSVVYFRTHGSGGLLDVPETPVERVLKRLASGKSGRRLPSAEGLVQMEIDGAIWEANVTESNIGGTPPFQIRQR